MKNSAGFTVVAVLVVVYLGCSKSHESKEQSGTKEDLSNIPSITNAPPALGTDDLVGTLWETDLSKVGHSDWVTIRLALHPGDDHNDRRSFWSVGAAKTLYFWAESTLLWREGPEKVFGGLLEKAGVNSRGPYR